MATHSSLPAWRIPGRVEPDGLQLVGLQRVRHDWVTHIRKQRLLFTCSVVSNSLSPHGLQHASLPCPSLYPRVRSNSCPSSRWCRPTISYSVVPFSCLQSFPASGSFPMSQFFTSGGQSIGASASALVFPVNIQDWFPLGLTGLISLPSKGLSTVFSNTTVQKFYRLWMYNSIVKINHLNENGQRIWK